MFWEPIVCELVTNVLGANDLGPMFRISNVSGANDLAPTFWVTNVLGANDLRPMFQVTIQRYGSQRFLVLAFQYKDPLPSAVTGLPKMSWPLLAVCQTR
jgi:hypothetical protein